MELKERAEIEEKYKWDLSEMYTSEEAWNEELSELDGDIKTVASFEGKLTDAENIRAYLDAETVLIRKLNKLSEYAMLRHDEDVRKPEGQRMYGAVEAAWAKTGAALSFAEPEILAHDEEWLKALAENPLLTDYAVRIRDMAELKPHVLSASEEKLLASMSEVLGAPKNIANQLQDADMVFESAEDVNGEKHELSGSNFVALQMNGDRVLRENVFKNYYKGYEQHINTYAASYSGAIKAMTVEAAARHYAGSLDMSLSGTHIPMTVYDNLISTVRKHMDLMYRYVALRKKILGVSELHFWDVYAPLVQGNDQKYTYEEACDLLYGTVAPMGEDYVNMVKQMVAGRQIDVFPNKGKRGGAYSSGVFDTKPCILMNFQGTLDSVSTLVHEMGHSMHTHHTCMHQPPQYADYTMFVAEVASTVNENLLSNMLLKDETDPKKRLYILNEYMEGFKGTVYRQTMFAEFEREAHRASERGEVINAEFLNNLYKKLVTDYFGPDMVIDDEIKYEWARIPHFYRPFYVYVYATGYCSAVALSEKIQNEGEEAVKRYREFLSMGSSVHPIDELKHAGVDLNTPEPIEKALEKFEKILDEVEELIEKI